MGLGGGISNSSILLKISSLCYSWRSEAQELGTACFVNEAVYLQDDKLLTPIAMVVARLENLLKT